MIPAADFMETAQDAIFDAFAAILGLTEEQANDMIRYSWPDGKSVKFTAAPDEDVCYIRLEQIFKDREKEIAEYYQQEEERAEEYWNRHPDIQGAFGGDLNTYKAYFLSEAAQSDYAKGDYDDFIAYLSAKLQIWSGAAEEKDLVDMMYGYLYSYGEDPVTGMQGLPYRDSENQAWKDHVAGIRGMFLQEKQKYSGTDVYKYYFDLNATNDAHDYGLDDYIAALQTSSIEGVESMAEEALRALASRISGLGLSPGFASNFSTLDDLYRSLKGLEEEKAVVTVETDNAQSESAIDETEQSMEDIDGTTAETTIVTKHVHEYYGDYEDDGEEDVSFQAFGGRFNSPTRGEFGEDGTEYIIPITKPSRARGLILQMFREMGSRANSILEDLGVPMDGGGDLSGPGQPYYRQPAGMYPSAGSGGSIKSNSDNTVTAPTTINVYGSGDPKSTGEIVANVAEKNIVRGVRRCFEG